MNPEGTDLIVTEPSEVASWNGAASRGLKARHEREAIIKSVLRKDTDFGVIPGTGNKPTLLKAGAEKIADSLNLWPDYEIIEAVRNWEKPFFNFDIRCTLRSRGANLPIATGLGSCNSMEAKYRWRDSQRKCPLCGTTAIVKGKQQFGGGWLCFAKKGGCGKKWPDGAEEIESQKTQRVENDDIYSQVNTIEKMAQKRALVAATLNLGFSDHFTQDLEDNSQPTSAEEIPLAGFSEDFDREPPPLPEEVMSQPLHSDLPKVKAHLYEELLDWPVDKRDDVVRRCSTLLDDNGAPKLKDNGQPICVESLAQMLSEKISNKWAGATLSRIREMKARLKGGSRADC